jgi:hypothetical protein
VPAQRRCPRWRRARRRYVVGDADPRPAVVAFNGVVSSLAVATLLTLVGAIPAPDAAQINYLPLKARLMHEPVRAICDECAEIRGVGSSRPLPWHYAGAVEGAA